jgi:anionic cell wall polymer biosynthesis LytR-Cps2A-Psr (LCP) family protein
VHIPAARDRIVLVSVLRDLRVPIPEHGQEKLNAAYAYGGFPLVSRTLTQLTGVHFDGGAVVSFTGLQKVVDAAGGVNMYVDETTTSIHTGFTKDGRRVPYQLVLPGADQVRPVPGVTPAVYHVGNQHLAGWQAVDYLRQRYLLANGDGDAGRQRHVRQLVSALLHQLRTDGWLTDPARLAKLLNAVGQATTVDTGGVPMEDMVFTLVQIPPNLVGIQVPVTLSGPNEERLGPGATSLFSALVGDDLSGWITDHPDAVTPK